MTPDVNAARIGAVTRDRWRDEYLPILDRCRTGELAGWRTLRGLLDNRFIGYAGDEDACDYPNWPVATPAGPDTAPNSRGVSLAGLVAGLAFHAGDYASAASIWRTDKLVAARTHTTVRHFLDLTSHSPDLNVVKEIFVRVLGESKLAQLEQDLNLSSLVRMPLRSTNAEFERLWQSFRQRIYPCEGEWRASPFAVGVVG